MNITTRAQDFEMTRAIDRFARQQLSAGLDRFSDGIVALDVFMKDANGPRGGVDKQVLIRARLRNRTQIALVSTSDDLYSAIRSGVKRTKRAVRRQLRKARRFDKLRLGTALQARGLAAATQS